MQKTSKQKALEKEAREKIAGIRRNGFNPSDELVNKAIRKCGPVKAFLLMRLAASADRDIFEEVH